MRMKMKWSKSLTSRILSMVHAIYVSFIALRLLFAVQWDDQILSPLIAVAGNVHRYELWESMFSATVAYFSFDACMMCLFYSKGDSMFLLHHLIGAPGIYIIWKFPAMWFLGLYFELTELTTVFLNISWMHVKMESFGLSFKVSGFLLVTSFFVIRVIGAIPIWYMLVSISSDMLEVLPWWINLYAFLGTGLLTILNFMWFDALIRSMIMKLRDPRLE